MQISRYRKAIAALVAAAATIAASYGFNMFTDPEVQAAVVSIVTAVAVFVVPNKD